MEIFKFIKHKIPYTGQDLNLKIFRADLLRGGKFILIYKLPSKTTIAIANPRVNQYMSIHTFIYFFSKKGDLTIWGVLGVIVNKLGLDLQNVLPRVRYPVQMGQVINIPKALLFIENFNLYCFMKL